MSMLVLNNQSATRPLPAATANEITAALNYQLRHLAGAWGETVFGLVDRVVADGFQIVLFDNPDVANALGYHDVGPDGKPYARVFLDPIFNNGGSWTGSEQNEVSVSSVISHEMCEMVGDPGANRWANDKDGTMWALELCDAVESDAYPVHVTLAPRQPAFDVWLSNFVFPAYFNPLAPAGSQFDMMSKVTAPFEIRPGGYAIKQTAGTESQVFGEDYPEWRKATKVAGSRTAARAHWPHA